MDDAEKRKYYEKLTESELLKHKETMGPGSSDGQIITQILAERRELPQKQFEKTYNLARTQVNLARFAAGVAVVGALAAWAAVWFQSTETRDALNQSRQPSASIAPTPSPSP